MKTNINIVYLYCLLLLTSCVQDVRFDPPELNITPREPVGIETTFSAVYAAYESALARGETSYTFSDELYCIGYVISSDKANNFFEELIIQNTKHEEESSNNPRLGLKLLINSSGLYQEFEWGRKVYIQLKDLTVGKSNGVIVLGKTNSLHQIQSYAYRNHVIRSPELVEITPKSTSIERLIQQDYNTLIQLEHVQFDRNQLAWTFAGEAFDEFDGFRTLKSCESPVSITLETSTYSDFKSVPIPNTKGNLQAIYARNYSDDFDVLILNTMSDIRFDTTQRCDPMELDCGYADSHGGEVLLEESFESQRRNTLIEVPGWTNYMEQGTEAWEAYTATGSNASLGVSARMGSYQSGDQTNIAWLISPKIDLVSNSNVTLSFKTSNSFADGSILEVWYSSDWDGNEATIISSTWGILSNAYVVQNDDLFSSWFTSGLVSLSCASNYIYIAFKYTGSTHENFDGSYELDDILISAN